MHLQFLWVRFWVRFCAYSKIKENIAFKNGELTLISRSCFKMSANFLLYCFYPCLFMQIYISNYDFLVPISALIVFK